MASQVLLEQASAAQTTAGCTPALNVNNGIAGLIVNLNVTAISGTGTPTLTVFVEGLDACGVWYSLWAPTGITATGDTTTSIGPGLTTTALVPPQVRFRWTLSGTSPSFTFSASIVGRDIS